MKCPPPRHLKHSLLFSTVFTLSRLERSLNVSHLYSPCCPEHTGQLLFVPICLLALLRSSLRSGSTLVAKVVILVRVLLLFSSLSGLAIRSPNSLFTSFALCFTNFNKSENFGLPPASMTLPAHSAHFPLKKGKFPAQLH